MIFKLVGCLSASKLKYYQILVASMVQGIKVMTLRFTEEDHKKLTEKKGSLTWEEFVIKSCLLEEVD
jgi:hypothetical protein